MDASRIEKAIEIVNDSRRSHETWLEWYRLHPEDEAKHGPTCGDSAWQRQCIEGYDLVLDVLNESLRESQQTLVIPPENVRFGCGEVKAMDRDGNVVNLIVVPGTST